MQGWVKMHRKILENELWQDVTAFRLFTLLLLKASHKDGIKTAGIEVNRGQYLRSYSKLSEDLAYMEGRGLKKISKSTIERKVKKLVDAGIVSIRETLHGTLFTIVKYESYQGNEETPRNDSGTDNETKLGRPRDDGGTKVGQEQELKNLRIKESLPTSLPEPASPEMQTSEIEYTEALLNRYVQLRAYGFDPTPKDRVTAREIKLAGVPLETAIKAMEKKFADYKPTNPRDRINSLSYCAGAILDMHHRPVAIPDKSPEQQKLDQEYNYGF